MKVNIIEKIKQDQYLELLRKIVSPIITLICWSVRISYGDEVKLHIGDKVPYSSKKLIYLEKGSWVFGTRGTDWKLLYQDQVITSSVLNVETFEQKIKVIEGSKISDFDIHYPSLVLTITFSNNYHLIILPDLEDDDSDVAYWELFTPEHMVIEVNPRFTWSYLPSNVPLTNL
ncbi:hypothetical protein [Chroococcus sp. FPU101]|uniref:hypothetical protein n=1 Tax=Chroococcus sp. FPU101 TaxID=1974212 RepID=UPI001A8C42C3|nr:hypothetical protein [Chroococcus sp. FPU101]GFE68255.1 hypothetical protein CFPU101_08650 [Chroococcus sp. FPU101]